jgi:Flp pilus assembly protein TadG
MMDKFLQTCSRPTLRFAAALFAIAKKDRGSESVEFALSLSLWIGAAFMVMYGSFALYAAHFVANAAEEACRYAMVRGSSWNGASCATSALDCTATSDDISSYVKSALPPGMSSANLSVSSSWPGTTASGGSCDTEDGVNSSNCIVKVTVTYQFTFPVPFFTQNTLPLKSTSIVTISQ